MSAQLFSEIKETLENSKQLLANVEAYCGLVEEVSLGRSFSLKIVYILKFTGFEPVIVSYTIYSCVH